MIFDVQEILKTDGARVRLEGKLVLPQEDDGIVFHEDAVFSGTMTNVGGVLEFEALAEGSFSVPCARCMKMTEQRFSVSVFETLADESAEITDRDAIIPLPDTAVDLDAVIWPEVLLNLQTRYLCKPDCKGLCAQCGTDLNEASCDCREDDIDPRLAGLKDLLQ
ncbi:MAG: DUF177 domain-containing protein [Clostridia bacterium]|nr:DUF177 domain-containing protein [Clostridia bacterium]